MPGSSFKSANPPPERTGIVSKIYGAYYNIRPEPELHPELPGKLRGRLRLAHREEGPAQGGAAGPASGRPLRQRHLLMIGDRVLYTHPRPGEPVRVQSLLPRRNALYRAVHSRLQAFGANLDRAVLMMSLAQPEPNFRFLDRLLVSCHAADIRPLLVFSKIDLVAQGAEVLALVDLYESLGYPVFPLNLTAGELETDPAYRAFRAELSAGSTVIVGRSGTGKSTLLNRLLGGGYQKTDSISSVGKGRHTTTNSTLFLYNNDRAFLIDTPGVKEWGVAHVDRQAALAAFPELADCFGACEFSNCDHRPDAGGCAVQQRLNAARAAAEAEPDRAAEPAPLHRERYYSLLAILDSIG